MAFRENSKILICDDHPISRLGVQYALKELFPRREFRFDQVSTGKDAVEFVLRHAPELMILDLRLPDISGLDVLEELRAKNSTTQIMVLTGEENLPTLLQLMRFDVHAVLLKSYSVETLKTAIDHIESDRSTATYYDPALEARFKAASKKAPLTKREFEVLEMLMRGYTQKAIASLLECSPETIKTHKTNIVKKTQSRHGDDLSDWFYEKI